MPVARFQPTLTLRRELTAADLTDSATPEIAQRAGAADPATPAGTLTYSGLDLRLDPCEPFADLLVRDIPARILPADRPGALRDWTVRA